MGRRRIRTGLFVVDHNGIRRLRARALDCLVPCTNIFDELLTLSLEVLLLPQPASRQYELSS